MEKRILSTAPFFLRTYVVVVIIILLAGWFLDSFLERNHDAQIEKANIKKLIGTFLYIDSQLPPQTNDADKSNDITAVSQLSEKATQSLLFPVNFIHKDDFSTTDHLNSLLNNNQVIVLHNNRGDKVYYRASKKAAYIIAIGPLEQEQRNDAESWVTPLFYFILASAILAWAWPLVKNLNALIQASNKLGTDDFATRIELPRTSSIYPVAQTFNQMAERIQFLISSQRELSNAVSHELRTPLARMKFSLEMLSGKLQNEGDLDYIHNMKSDIDEVDTLIEEMLNYAKLESDNLRLNIEKVDIISWLEKQKLNWQRHSPSLTISIVIKDSANSSPSSNTVMIESHLMARALSNLIRNAQRYANDQVEVSVSLDPNHCTLRVGDNGPGIPAQDREKVFSAFTRLDSSRARTTGGYGLGLAIVKRIMGRHDGQVSIATSHLGGAEFVLKWPRIIQSNTTS